MGRFEICQISPSQSNQVLVGDHRQLRPVVKNRDAGNLGRDALPGPVPGNHGGSLVASDISGDETEDDKDLMRVVISTDGGDW